MIEREEHEGTVSLIVKPLAGGGLRSMMRIRADIHRSEDDRRNPHIEVFFHGSAYAGQGGRMSVSDARTWGAALEGLIAEAEKVAREMQAEERGKMGSAEDRPAHRRIDD